MMDYKIVDKNKTKQFWCKSCKVASGVLYKHEMKRYCELCVPKDVKYRCIVVNQSREVI